MSKDKNVYVCNACGFEAPKWQGQCPGCQEWNTLQETKNAPQGKEQNRRYQGYAGDSLAKPKKLGDVGISGKKTRMKSGFDEFDRVLGGGFVDGGVLLLGGDPGIGKSTLLLQVISKMPNEIARLYVSGEESAEQIAMRAARLGSNSSEVEVFCEVELEKIIGALEASKPKIAVIDSIQTIYSSELGSAPGSVPQVRECSAVLARYAKTSGCVIVIVGHVTKDGGIAGPRVLEHIVDTVLFFEGDPQSSCRMIRAFKNRFGAIHEIGVFSMGENGLEEVGNPSAMFLAKRTKPVAGACVVASSEGARPILAEAQALVEDSHSPNPRRLCVGMDPNRLAMILAVLQKNAQMDCHDQNVFLNITGGIRLGEPGADLPALLAVVSSIRNKPLPDNLVAFGEIGLTGELRMVQKGFERLNESAKLGFTKAIIPRGNIPKQVIPGMEIKHADTVVEALQAIREWESK